MQKHDDSVINVPSLPVAFLDVDTQKDFIRSDGCLSIKGAGNIVTNLGKLCAYALENRVAWFASMDSHVPGDTEISEAPDYDTTFPPHCMNSSEGEERIPETFRQHPLVFDIEFQYLDKPWSYFEENYDSIVFKKNNFDVFSNKNFDQFLTLVRPKVFVVFGVATDFCVRRAVEGLCSRKFKTVVVKDAVFAIDQETERKLFDEWERQGIKLMATEEVIDMEPREFEKLF